MNFKRLFIVVVVVTTCGGLFGGAVGGLLGFAVPQSFNAFFGVKHYEAPKDVTYEQQREQQSNDPTSGTNLRMSLNTEQSKIAAGAAIGGAWGLILGSIFGMGFAALDQILLAIRGIAASRTTNQKPAQEKVSRPL